MKRWLHSVTPLLVSLLLVSACDLGREREIRLPDPAEAAARYGPAAEAALSGNLLEVRMVMAESLLSRGGVIWARSGPYFYLFSPPTQELFTEYPDLAAVRVVVVTEDADEVARAQLVRDALNEPRWRQALRLSAVAQQTGTERPRTLEELTYFGEEHTEFRYDPEYAGN
jgi:hypothetical protein